MTTNASPLFDFANKGTLTGVFEHVLNKVMQNKIDHMLPCQVVSGNRMRVTVQPLIKVVGVDGSFTNRSPQANLPVFTYGAGGFLISVPIVPGSIGWILASDRDISLYMQNASSSPPNTNRMHSFSDGWFIPDYSASNITFSSADDANLIISSLDGTTKITVGPGGINLSSPVAVNITSPILTHNGVNIGSTHEHTNVEIGTSISGPPVA